MDMLSILSTAAVSPATGDQFPVIPLVLIGGLAVIIAVVSSVVSAVAADQDVAATVTNKKDTIVDMGIDMDSAPYFVILAVAMFGMVALVSKKRYEV